VVWRSPLAGGEAVAWSTDSALGAPGGGFGANGVKVRGGALWVTNYEQGTLLRIPFRIRGEAGPVRVVASALGEVDDFTFTGRADDVLVALNPGNAVLLVRSDGTRTTVLNSSDGLQSPTSLVRCGHSDYVANAAYFTSTDPNLTVAQLRY
jgi:hypothetical protein